MRRLRYHLAGNLVALAIRIMPRGRIRSEFHAVVLAWGEALANDMPE